MVLMQFIIGIAKVKSKQQHSRHKFHGDAGKLTYDLAMLAIVTGCLEFLPWTAYNLGVIFSFWLLWLSIQVCALRSVDGRRRGCPRPPFVSTMHQRGPPVARSSSTA